MRISYHLAASLRCLRLQKSSYCSILKRTHGCYADWVRLYRAFPAANLLIGTEPSPARRISVRTTYNSHSYWDCYVDPTTTSAKSSLNTRARKQKSLVLFIGNLWILQTCSQTWLENAFFTEKLQRFKQTEASWIIVFFNEAIYNLLNDKKNKVPTVQNFYVQNGN